MTKLCQRALLALVIFGLVKEQEATASLFFQAITSALATIPFSAGPITTGLVGAKLAIGAKLLFYLGYFGQGRSKPKPPPMRPPKNTFSKPGGGGGFPAPGGSQFGGGLPLPYALSGAGGFPPQQPGGGLGPYGVFPPQQPGGGLGNYGGFPPQQPGGGQGPYGGFDPAELFQALAAQGIDPNLAMQAMNREGGGFGGDASSFEQTLPQGGGGFNQFPPNAGVGNGGGGFGSMPHDVSNSLPPSPGLDTPAADGGAGSEEDIESFFTFLRDMDDNTCISRLMCDIGADPSFLGDFSENIHGIISSLEVLPSSGAYQYISIMEAGKREGGCSGRFPQCGDAAYEIVKNVAPSVGVPQNINSDMVNQL
ncbi:serine/threonine-protein phosphatase 1 regulatory subunit 10-like [Stegodyphus dumicola]|uniref:serine/threonine-protein phosphatase 1 regulatory subunit 10-like n=1 Tax=Stegodyphus dumicola TaxID=202533 RepID=UPI0015AF305B|nr:serine/threonine-protein phosphatase 1 regulatory subunit 10-like [Stegodyphus dumicola]